MHYAVTHELRVFQPRYHRKDALLLAEFQVRLEAHEIVHRAVPVLLAELNNGVGALPRARVGESHGLHAAVADALETAFCQHFHRHAALKHLHSGALFGSVEFL